LSASKPKGRSKKSNIVGGRFTLVLVCQEKFENTKAVIRSHNSKDRQTLVERKRTQGQTTIYKTLHRKLNIK